MAIKRAKRRTNFTMISNVGLRDKRLSLKAKGLLAYMLSLPDDWVFYESELTKHSTDGKQSVRNGLKELQQMGYLIKEQARNKSGKFGQVDWVIVETPENVDLSAFSPSTTLPSTDKPSAVKPSTDNQPLLNTNSTNDLSIPSTDLTKDIMSGSPDHGSSNDWFPKERKKHAESDGDDIPYAEIVSYLNDKADKQYKPTTAKTKSCIKARWNEGFRVKDFRSVVDTKVSDWKENGMSKYLRPETLFGTKFEGYLNEKRGDVHETEYDHIF